MTVPDEARMPPLRTHQAQALAALEDAWSEGRRRAWVVLPPGAGKTRVGLETVADALTDGVATRAVVLAPNTAIQAQWVAQARARGLGAGDDRDLTAAVTCLTYQSLAVFDADAEVADDPGDPDDPCDVPDLPRSLRTALLDRLHPNGRALVERLRATDGLLLVLDECHHLLEVWGRLLGELLHTVEDARVLGLTATPPDALTADQADLVAELFGEVVFRAGVPAVVKEGDLAPFAELAWLTTPTAHEAAWLAEEATRWEELVAHLTDPAFGSLPFLQWVTARFVTPVPRTRTWASLARAEPVLADAALRLSHAGLLALPEGARLLEQHRRRPDAEDWVALLDDWVVTHVARSDDPRDAEVLERVRAALPSVGHVLTRRGVRRGRTPVDRVLARSLSKTTAAVEIVALELSLLGARTRVLVLCDHEQASATLPTGLQGVLDVQSGSARAALEALVADPTTAVTSPLMVTGATVAGAPETLAALESWVVEHHPRLAGALRIDGDGPVSTLVGPWSSRSWVRPITTFFEAGHSQVLVGTRGLLGEGWDARRVTGLVDLTTATTLTAVVQTRGRALRTDPLWPDKVAVNWSVVCVTEDHPKGHQDWSRLVRKHEGFHGVDADGDVVDGVSHIDAAFSPYAPPPVPDFDAVNARMRARAAERAEIRRRWRVGERYEDRLAPTLRVTVPAPVAQHVDLGATVTRLHPEPPVVVLTADGVELRDPAAQAPTGSARAQLLASAVTGAGAVAGAAAPALGAGTFLGPVAAGLGLVAVGAGLAGLGRARKRRAESLAGWVRSQAAAADTTPPVGRVAAAVADALRAAGLTASGAAAVVVEVHPDGEHRCRLDGEEGEGRVFAEALDEALAPVAAPRYVVSRHTFTAPPRLPADVRARSGDEALRALRALRPDGEVWHQVPAVLGVNAGRADCFLAAWRQWVGGGRLLYSGSPEGAGVLAAQSGADPFSVTTVLRRHWL